MSELEGEARRAGREVPGTGGPEGSEAEQSSEKNKRRAPVAAARGRDMAVGVN